jgi:endonuclease/exonuclease/phosphatase family metal-dependent hydrolase
MNVSAAQRRGMRWAGIGSVVLAIGSALITSSSCERAAAELPVPEEVPLPVIGKTAWASRESCQRKLTSRADAPRAGVARIATWNVRWFPDGAHDRQDTTRRTDVEWLACAIADLKVDVLAVQEFRVHARAVDAAGRLITTLNRLTGGEYRLELSKCGSENSPRLGFLYDQRRVQGSHFEEIAELNPESKCTDDALPGYAGYFRFRGGLDLHLVAIHTYAGEFRADFSKREISYAAMLQVPERRALRVADDDVVLMGDFNTSGCRDCDTRLLPGDELRWVDDKLRSAPVKLWRVPNDLACSEYHDGKAWSYDHFVISRSTRELASGTRARVGGYCQALRCRHMIVLPKSEAHLSDHCPIALELLDRDLD